MLEYRSRRTRKHLVGYTAAMLMMGREMRLPTDVVMGSKPPDEDDRKLPNYLTKLQERLQKIRQGTREHLKTISERMKAKASGPAYKEHDLVWL